MGKSSWNSKSGSVRRGAGYSGKGGVEGHGSERRADMQRAEIFSPQTHNLVMNTNDKRN